MLEKTIRPHSKGTVHLVAICGSGMGAFAGLLRAAGYRVTGSDANVYPPMSTQLADWGIPVAEGHRPENLDHAPDLVVVGNFCRRDNPECLAAVERGIPFMSMPQALAALFLSSRHPVVVAGTHGKTTSTGLIAHLLRVAGSDPSALVGGIVTDFGGPFLTGSGPHFVVEGDEYDTAFFDKGPKFLHYLPRTAMLTSIEYDHADIYPDMESYLDSFRRFAGLIPPNGLLAACWDEPLVRQVSGLTRAEVRRYGLGPQCAVRATEVEASGGGTQFTLVVDGIELDGQFFLSMAGLHNLRNALGAIAVCRSLGVGFEDIRTGLANFSGVAKRQQVVGQEGGVVVVDDFANHPTAVRETIAAMRSRYPGRRLWAVFEAKSNSSRRRVFQDDYARALGQADLVVVARPFLKKDTIPAEERLDVERLVEDTRGHGAAEAYSIPEVEDIVRHVATNAAQGDVVLIMSGSGFGGIQPRLVEALALR